MARADSLDLRERAVAAVRSGQTCRQVAATFGLGASTVVKWCQRYRATGRVAAKPRGGSQARALVDMQDWVLKRVAAEPHVSTRALAEELAERGTEVSHVTVWSLLRRERLTHKKNRARQRLRWRTYQDRIDPRRLVFIDETWAKTNMAPLRGWCRRGRASSPRCRTVTGRR
jgi:transposase